MDYEGWRATDMMRCASAAGRVDLGIMTDLKRHLNATMTPFVQFFDLLSSAVITTSHRPYRKVEMLSQCPCEAREHLVYFQYLEYLPSMSSRQRERRGPHRLQCPRTNLMNGSHPTTVYSSFVKCLSWSFCPLPPGWPGLAAIPSSDLRWSIISKRR